MPQCSNLKIVDYVEELMNAMVEVYMNKVEEEDISTPSVFLLLLHFHPHLFQQLGHGLYDDGMVLFLFQARNNDNGDHALNS